MNRTTSALIVVFAVAVAMGSQASGNRGPAEPVQAPVRGAQEDVETVRQLELARLQAGLAKDVDTVASATADDYIQIDIEGKTLDKPAMLQRIKSSYAQLRANPVEDMLVRVYGDTAVLTGLARPRGVLNGKEFTDAVRYTRVYARRGSKWQVVLFQQTRVTGSK